MTLAEFIGSIITALLFTLLFRYALRVRGPWGSFWLFFVVVLFGVITVGVWIEPFGPMYGNVAWGPLIAGGLILSLLLAAATPTPSEQKDIIKQLKSHRRQKRGMKALNVFFWTLLVFFGAVIAIGLTT